MNGRSRPLFHGKLSKKAAFILAGVYIPFRPNTNATLQMLTNQVNKLKLKQPDSLPHHPRVYLTEQNVTRNTESNVLDHCYWTLRVVLLCCPCTLGCIWSLLHAQNGKADPPSVREEAQLNWNERAPLFISILEMEKQNTILYPNLLCTYLTQVAAAAKDVTL